MNQNISRLIHDLITLIQATLLLFSLRVTSVLHRFHDLILLLSGLGRGILTQFVLTELFMWSFLDI